jgi:4'-phosphopantetheinyl transferase
MPVPPLQRYDCQIWWAHAVGAENNLLLLLDDRERARLNRFVRSIDRALYLTAHALTRILLGAHLAVAPGSLRFSTLCRYCGRDHGKPRVDVHGGADIEFSISHSGRRVALAVARGMPIGVDVEQMRPSEERVSLTASALSAVEKAVFHSLPAGDRELGFLRYWTRKEALLKATGHGLALAMNELTVTPPDAPPTLLAWPPKLPISTAAHMFDLNPGPGYVGSLAALDARPTVVEHDAAPLLGWASAPRTLWT